MFGKMKDGAILLSTTLRLNAGQRVKLTPATNQPDKSQFFARPADGVWPNGLVDEESSILIRPDEVEIE